jgi:sec-independent protein translocase protein TatB
MFDMSWGEVMVIGGVALIVIGPKDLPKALRTVGQMTAKVRRLASEFQGQFSEAMREAELDEVRREVEGLNRQVASATTAAFNPIQTIRDELKTAVDTKVASYEADGAAAGSAPVPVVEEAGPIPHIGPVAEPILPLPDAVVPVPPELTGPGLEPAPADMPPPPAHAAEPTPLKSAQA